MAVARLGEARDVSLARELAYFGHWITAPGRARRFDTRFFLAHAPEDQAGAHDGVELVASLWLRPQEAIEVLSRFPGVLGAALFGGGIHAAVERGSATPAGIAEAIRSAGFAVQRAEEIAPTLEDVFVSLVEGRDRAAGPVGEVRG